MSFVATKFEALRWYHMSFGEWCLLLWIWSFTTEFHWAHVGLPHNISNTKKNLSKLGKIWIKPHVEVIGKKSINHWKSWSRYATASPDWSGIVLSAAYSVCLHWRTKVTCAVVWRTRWGTGISNLRLVKYHHCTTYHPSTTYFSDPLIKEFSLGNQRTVIYMKLRRGLENDSP